MTNSPATPKKDVIYIDTEDDITSIIGKLKSASASIVALVPPKRVGVLQSIVNLKLLQRAAEQSNKRVVLITSDAALGALAAGVQMPVAKNLQSKPEIVSTEIEDDVQEDVIDGEENGIVPPALPYTASSASSTPAPGPSTVAPAAKTPLQSKKKISIPNFDSFRNKILLFSGLGVALAVFLVWAIFFAPRAIVTVTSRTTPYDVNVKLTSAPDKTLEAEAGVLPGVIKETKKSASADFTATGKKDVGEKATGTIKITRDGVSSDTDTIPAGTGFSSGDYTFVTTEAVTIPASRIIGRSISSGSATARVAATEIGEEYNLSARNYKSSLSGYDASGSQMTGGSKRQVSVVSEQDVAAARDKISAQDVNAIKAELKAQFTNKEIIVEESFLPEPATPVISPAVGSEATSGKYTVETTYRMLGVEQKDLQTIVEANIKEQIKGIPNQKIFNNGIGHQRFSDVTRSENGYELRVKTTGYVGPYIDEKALKQKIAGKREGEIQADLKTYDGVQSVDVKMSPFWVSSAPAPEKITVKFQISGDAKNQ